MKKWLLFLIPLSIVALMMVYKSTKKEGGKNQKSTMVTIPSITDKVLETAIIYEANIRQYSEAGTFEMFTKDIPQLKGLGVKIIWLMPIFPISEIRRKATNDTFVEDHPEDQRSKYLGSYYSVSDYTKINPEFGTLQDFRNLIATAHKNGIYVILDWVPNHTGWDHKWITEHPEFYTKNSKGKITDPIKDDGTPWGWTDVADLDFSNQAMHEAMITDMLKWVEEENIDGFRCDVAHGVPVSFWEKAIPRLRAKKQIFMLAEAQEATLMKGTELFDMGYGWETHHKTNTIAQAKEPVSAWNKLMEKNNREYEADDILMNFVTNHDENTWAGTVKDRYGDAAEAFTVLVYAIKGMPLIYSGQEYDLNHRLKFFEKDLIPHTKGKTYDLLKKLGMLKQTKIALHGGKKAASYHEVSIENEKILTFKRKKNNKTIIYMANMSKSPQTFKIPLKGKYVDLITDNVIDFDKDTYRLSAWQYVLLEKK